MNYRQWKKNYKKTHGCNPTADVDKRKQIKIAKELLCKRHGSLSDALNNFTKTFSNAMANIFEAMSDVV